MCHIPGNSFFLHNWQRGLCNKPRNIRIQNDFLGPRIRICLWIRGSFAEVKRAMIPSCSACSLRLLPLLPWLCVLSKVLSWACAKQCARSSRRNWAAIQGSGRLDPPGWWLCRKWSPAWGELQSARPWGSAKKCEHSRLMCNGELFKISQEIWVIITLDQILWLPFFGRNLVAYNWSCFNPCFVIFASKRFWMEFNITVFYVPHPQTLHGLVVVSKKLPPGGLSSQWFINELYSKHNKNVYNEKVFPSQCCKELFLHWVALPLQRNNSLKGRTRSLQFINWTEFWISSLWMGLTHLILRLVLLF